MRTVKSAAATLAPAYRPMGSANAEPGIGHIWAIYRNIIAAAKPLALSNQALTTLRALISFLQSEQDLVVFASNRSLAARADGISERTIRRHIGHLVDLGLLIRRDSPNRKRYTIKSPDGDLEAFGVDLGPLLVRAGEFAEMAAATQRELAQTSYLRRKLGALLYRAAETGVAQGHTEEIRPYLRRKCGVQILSELVARVEKLIAAATPAPLPEAPEPALPAGNATDLSASDGNNVRHNMNSYPKKNDSDCSPPAERIEICSADLLRKVKETCTEAMSYAEEEITTWPQLERLAYKIGGWLGIGQDLLVKASASIGRSEAAITVLCLLQRNERLHNLPGYFNALTIGKRSAGFKPMSLLT